MADPADEFGDHNIVRAYESGLPMEEDRLAIAAVVSNLRPADEVAANARLIAAAPDLLEALGKAVSLIEHLARCSDDTLDEHHADDLDAARAAIAEATGQ